MNPIFRFPCRLRNWRSNSRLKKLPSCKRKDFEGGLITDTVQEPAELFSSEEAEPAASPFYHWPRARSLPDLPTAPDKDGQFLCSREDLRALSAKRGNRRAKMEVEANRFSSIS